MDDEIGLDDQHPQASPGHGEVGLNGHRCSKHGEQHGKKSCPTTADGETALAQ
jgi:hypothetical protein